MSLLFQPEDCVFIFTNFAEYSDKKRSCWKKDDHVDLVIWLLRKHSDGQTSSAHVLGTVMPNIQKLVSLAWVGCCLGSLWALPQQDADLIYVRSIA
jgi:hypothetical protein